jgi:hypothetical protein
MDSAVMKDRVDLILGILLTQRASSGPPHKRTEGRAPVWGSEFTSKAANKLDLI